MQLKKSLLSSTTVISPSKMSTTDLTTRWSSSHVKHNYQLKSPTPNQSPWALLLILLPFVTVFIGGLIWPTDVSQLHTNPLRPPQWFFYLAWSVVTLAYGLVWNQMYIEHPGRFLLHFAFALPIIFSLLWLILFNGAGLAIEASWVMFALQASLIGVVALTAGLSDTQEWIIFLVPFLALGLLITSLSTQEALEQ